MATTMPTLTLLSAAFLAACTDGEDGDSGVIATLSIIAPEDGDVLCTSAFDVVMDIEGITLVDPYTPPDPLPPDSGHPDITLNGQDVVMCGCEEITVEPDPALFGPGEYQLKAELSNADHTPVVPYAGDFLYITLSDEACTP